MSPTVKGFQKGDKVEFLPKGEEELRFEATIEDRYHFPNLYAIDATLMKLAAQRPDPETLRAEMANYYGKKGHNLTKLSFSIYIMKKRHDDPLTA